MDCVDDSGMPGTKFVRVGAKITKLTRPDGSTIIASSRYDHPERKVPDVNVNVSAGSSCGNSRRVNLLANF